jgi:cyclopropane-fatty-acyl-phospholipid synthase
VTSLRLEPTAARGRALEGIAMSILANALADIRGGSLVVVLPDGTTRAFGEGRPVLLDIRDRAFFRRVATRGKLGLGESYTAGEWATDDLVGLFELLLQNAGAAGERHARVRRLLELRPRLNRRNGLLRARRNISYHYDLGNDLFELMLDETMTYSCGIFESPQQSLADAQCAKYERLCTALSLGPDDHVLEIGCGWGGFAEHAATRHGSRVTGLTISREQAAYARERTAGLPVEIREQDYRTVEGEYTKVVSIEMIEAIGADQFETYFATIDRVLAPGGLAAVQSILVPEQRWDRYRTTPDWIERYVFPGCLIPSLESLTHALKTTTLAVYGIEEIGEHYAETLRRWRHNVVEHVSEIRALGYDRRFERTWEFYLSFCEAGFRTRWLRDAQLLLARAG